MPYIFDAPITASGASLKWYLDQLGEPEKQYAEKNGINVFQHLNELAEAAREGWHCAIAFVIQMNGIQKVLPNKRTDPAFGKALSEAEKKGVQVRCLPCRVERDRIWILDGASFY
jgi:sugar fermentation stimulation protein A